ncbi:MAG TPA: hypothetical protein PLN69_12440 [bacterium]|nr:hypothetical protein [bacterium]
MEQRTYIHSNGAGGARQPSKLVDYHDEDRKRALITGLILIALLLIALGAIVYKKYVYPKMPVGVQLGTVWICPLDGKEYDRDVKEIKVPRSEAGNYGISVEEYCPMEAMIEWQDLSQEEFERLINYDKLKEDPLVREVLKRHPKWNPVAAWFVSRRKVALNLTVEQLEEIVGKPLKEVTMDTRHGLVYRYYYGDPLYGLEIKGFYVDILNDRVVDHQIQQRLIDKYWTIMDEKRQGILDSLSVQRESSGDEKPLLTN